jgi:hypothetical protein
LDYGARHVELNVPVWFETRPPTSIAPSASPRDDLTQPLKRERFGGADGGFPGRRKPNASG